MNDIFSRIPSFKESRLRSLFSDFSSLEQINPEGYEANILAWEEVLIECLRTHKFNSSITLPIGLLLSDLAHPQFGQAKSLGAVVNVLIKRRVFVSLRVYQHQILPYPILSDVVSPFKLLQRLKNAFFSTPVSLLSSRCSTSDYIVHWETLATSASNVFEKLSTHVESSGRYSARVLNFEMFKKFVKVIDGNLSNTDVEALLIYLWKDRGFLDCRAGLSAQKDLTSYTVKVSRESINSTDLGILNVKVNIVKIKNRVTALERLVDKRLPERLEQMHILKASNTRLKSLLKHKSQLKQSLDSANVTLDQLAFLLAKIDDAQQTEDVFESLKSASAVLSSFNQKASIADFNDLISDFDSSIVATDEVSVAIDKISDQEIEDFEEKMESQSSFVEEKEENATSSSPGKQIVLKDVNINAKQNLTRLKELDLDSAAINKLLSTKIASLSISNDPKVNGSSQAEHMNTSIDNTFA